jgi:tRNA (guanine-N7-)-methyltransferase
MPLDQAQALHQSRLDELRPQLEATLADHSRVTLEIGCGHGHFLTAYAEAHPDEFCLGVDLLGDRLARAARKSKRQGLGNIDWFQAEAALFLAALPSQVRLNGNIFVLFPDPWPKRRHWKHRLMCGGFLSALAERAGPGAQLCFRTDYGPYFAAALQAVEAHPAWRLALDTPWPFEQPTVFQSRATTYQSWIAFRQ